jgi:hypothetical protein
VPDEKTYSYAPISTVPLVFGEIRGRPSKSSAPIVVVKFVPVLTQGDVLVSLKLDPEKSTNAALPVVMLLVML